MNPTERLLNYQARVEAWVPHSCDSQYDKEQNTLVKFVVPLLELLGWDPWWIDVGFECALWDEREGRGKRVDCALYLLDGEQLVPGRPKPKILVEVKPFQRDEVRGSLTGD